MSFAQSISRTVQGLNPVLDREMRQRARTPRSMVVMTIFLLVALGTAYVAYLGETEGFDGEFLLAGQSVGRTMFEWVLVLMLTVMLFVVPGISAGAITGERDRQTLIPLQVTLIGPAGIFFGKVLSSAAFVVLMIVASTPILAVAYLLGGVAFSNIIWGIAALIVVGLLLAVIGVACSAFMRRTAAATLITYGVVLAMTIGTVFAFYVGALVIGMALLGLDDPFFSGSSAINWFLAPFYFNPFVLVAGAAGNVSDSLNFWPLSGIKQGFVEAERGFGAVEPAFVDDGDVVPGERADDVRVIPLWLRAFLAQGLLAGALALLGIRRLRTPQRSVTQ